MLATAQGDPKRWELYRVLSEPVRLRLLALAAEEELSIGELAELLGESQPNVSRHVKPLRNAGLLAIRKQGTRALVRFRVRSASDPVVTDALFAGRQLTQEDGSLGRVPGVVAARDQAAKEFFDRAPGKRDLSGVPAEYGAYLSALGALLPRRRFAVDVGTGDGRLIDIVAPVFDHVIGIDRSKAQLDGARERLERAGYDNVELLLGDYDTDQIRDRIRERGGADVLFASRILHHAPKPGHMVASLANLLAPDGVLVVIDYVAHGDEAMGGAQADLWLGFGEQELLAFAHAADLQDAVVKTIPATRCGTGPDGHLDWQVLVARRTPSDK